jgi:hypothetical protein
MATGLTKRESWNAILATEEVAERCNVTLPRNERLRYPGTVADLEPWTA